MLLNSLYDKGLVNPPKFLLENTFYLTAMGSVVYGVSGDMSDVDVYGFCLPPKTMVFPHLTGYVPGFGPPPPSFDAWQQHHVKDGDKEYDFTVFSVVKYFSLLMENNPNMLDSVFTPDRCVLHSTAMSQLVRDNRRLFLHAGCYPKFRGYAYQQLKKIQNKVGSANEKRAASIEKFGYDTKAAYHVVRLALECQEILTTGNLTLDKNAQLLKTIREGEWTFERLNQWFSDKERHLEDAYAQTKLPQTADYNSLYNLLMNCLESHYGSLEAAVVRTDQTQNLVNELQSVLSRYQ